MREASVGRHRRLQLGRRVQPRSAGRARVQAAGRACRAAPESEGMIGGHRQPSRTSHDGAPSQGREPLAGSGDESCREASAPTDRRLSPRPPPPAAHAHGDPSRAHARTSTAPMGPRDVGVGREGSARPHLPFPPPHGTRVRWWSRRGCWERQGGYDSAISRARTWARNSSDTNGRSPPSPGSQPVTGHQPRRVPASSLAGVVPELEAAKPAERITLSTTSSATTAQTSCGGETGVGRAEEGGIGAGGRPGSQGTNGSTQPL